MPGVVASWVQDATSSRWFATQHFGATQDLLLAERVGPTDSIVPTLPGMPALPSGIGRLGNAGQIPGLALSASGSTAVMV